MSRQNPTIKQQTINEITQATALLPETLAMTKRVKNITGADLLLLNKKTIGGKPIDANTIYRVNMPEWRPVNHKDQMVKIYTDAIRTMGHEEAYHQVCEYIKQVNAKHQRDGKKAKATS